MATGIHLFSQTASSNATADSSINWAEGQAPSSVNDSARALMARLADYYKDMGGILTGGSSTAYTVTTNRAFASAAVMNFSVITIYPHTTNGAAPTLAVDGLTARAINYASTLPVPAGALVANVGYQLAYIHASTEFVLFGGVGTARLPGEITAWGGSTAPTGWLLCFGQSLLRTDQPALFTAIGTNFGNVDGTHFNLPDLRGLVLAGRDDMGGSARGLLTTAGCGFDGASLGAAGSTQTLTLTQPNLPNVTLSLTGNLTNGAITIGDAKFETQSVRGDLSQVNVLRSGGSTLGITGSLASTALTGTTASINGNVTQTALSRVQPTMIVNYIIKT